jgi:hypothetical protein
VTKAANATHEVVEVVGHIPAAVLATGVSTAIGGRCLVAAAQHNGQAGKGPH